MKQDKEHCVEIVVGSLEKFVSRIEEISSQGGNYLFRGQLRKDKLLPNFFRNDTDIKFKTQKTEIRMLKDFKRRGKLFLAIEPQSEYEWLALSQHYGMPTRLLDWTSSALAALWFAVVHNRANVDDGGVVWVLKFTEEDQKNPSKSEDPFKIKKTKVFYPTHIEKRFTAQGGWFTLHGDAKPLNEQGNFKSKLTRIVIPSAKFENIRFSLNLCGMNQVTLFPDFGGLSKHIAWQKSKGYLKRKEKRD